MQIKEFNDKGGNIALCDWRLGTCLACGKMGYRLQNWTVKHKRKVKGKFGGWFFETHYCDIKGVA